MHFKSISHEVLIVESDVVKIGLEHIETIKKRALSSKKRRARICLHKTNDDKVHEMVIAICRNSYIRPHRHSTKMESFHLIEGEAEILIFADDGSIKDKIRLSFDDNILYRIDKDFYHTIIPISSVLVIHEVTNGPFIQNDSEYAEFSPEEGSDEVERYVHMLKNIEFSESIS
ncbi:MAG TPA: cupin fold metalloprotein, WbuC family [Candidatus Thioglobus sp.]|jgi:cupin fold WbuC family metalloprotein|nr:cupin fold metalloprotein, WbuC family [Candidatus Thioglobus sp.]